MSYNTCLCIIGFKSMRSFHCSDLVELHGEIKREKDTRSCIGKNSSIRFLVPFLFNSLFMALESWKNIIYERGTTVYLPGMFIPANFEKKIQSLGALTEI